MKTLRIFVLGSLLCAASFLQACGSGPSYQSSPWVFDNAPQPASERPSVLSDLETEPLEDAPLEAEALPPMAASDLPPVKVGILLPLSGKNAQLGEAMLNAAQMAMFEIGHNSFELVPRDTKGTSSGGRDAAQSAINDGAQLLLGPVFADAVRGAKTAARRTGVNIIAYSTDWSLADNSTFIMGILPFDQVERVIRYAASNGYQNFGVFAPSNAYGTAVLNAYSDVATSTGINTVNSERFSPNSSSLNAAMRRFSRYDERRAQTPEDEDIMPPPYDALFMPAGGNEARTVASFASQYGMRPEQVRRLGTGLMDDDSLAGEKALDGAWFAAPSPRLRRDFERKYFSTYGVSPPRIATLAYDSTALATVLARTGLSQRGRPLFDSVSIQNPNGFSGVDGIFRFREGGLVDRGLAVLEFRRGQISVIDPAPKTFQQRGF